MSNYPDNMDWDRYDATIGSAQSEALDAYDAAEDKLLNAVARAWLVYPEHTPEDAVRRWSLTMAAVRSADKAMESHAWLGKDTKQSQQAELGYARDANAEHDKEWLLACMAEYMGYYRWHIQTHGEE